MLACWGSVCARVMAGAGAWAIMVAAAASGLGACCLQRCDHGHVQEVRGCGVQAGRGQLAGGGRRAAPSSGRCSAATKEWRRHLRDHTTLQAGPGTPDPRAGRRSGAVGRRSGARLHARGACRHRAALYGARRVCRAAQPTRRCAPAAAARAAHRAWCCAGGGAQLMPCGHCGRLQARSGRNGRARTCSWRSHAPSALCDARRATPACWQSPMQTQWLKLPWNLWSQRLTGRPQRASGAGTCGAAAQMSRRRGGQHGVRQSA
jgi:hypothetical protein